MVRELVLCALVAPLLGTLVMRLLAERVGAGVAVVAFTVSACLLAVSTALVLLAGGIHTTTALVRTGKRGWTTEAWADAGRDAWLSGPFVIVAVVAAMSATRAFRRQRAALRAAEDEADALPGDDLVVIVPGAFPDAFTLPGARARIVVTEALRNALSPDELGVVLAHERAHLAFNHHRYVDATRLAAAGQPLLRPVARLVEYGVERWADERAALEIGDRARVARTIGTVALATRADPAVATLAVPTASRHSASPVEPHTLRIASPTWAVDAAAATAGGWRRRLGWLLHPARPGPVPRRVSAMLRPAPSGRHRMLVTIPAILSLSTCLWAGNIVYDVHTPLRVALTVEDQFEP